MPSAIYDIGLDRTPANFAALTPLSFVERSATVFPPARTSWSRSPSG
jgi:fatty-acyl-CoA synthase